MSKTKQKIILGEPNFKALREAGGLYVDKTSYIHKMITEGKFYFFSRPRRFGKSLLVSTLHQLFAAQKHLFEGLWIYDKWHWTPHPVVFLSFTNIDYQVKGLEEALKEMFDEIATSYGIRLQKDTAQSKFSELIQSLSVNGKVAVLIDEYDKPIIDYIDNYEQADANREVLKRVYGILKDVKISDFLELVFITGVSKFSKVSLFSDLNHLTDLSLSDAYSTFLGITQSELDNYFQPHLEALVAKEQKTEKWIRQQVKKWYDGYSWDGKNFVYNPFSLLSLFHTQTFENYWFRTATTSFLVKSIRNSQKPVEKIEAKRVGKPFFEKFSLLNIDIYVMLFQTGYLTIKQIKKRKRNKEYHLAYPNEEVRISMANNLFEEYANIKVSDIGDIIWGMEDALYQKDLEQFVAYFKEIFADVSTRLLKQYIETDDLNLWEMYYQSVIYLALKLVGVNIDCEVQTNKGYIDAVITTSKYIYIIEFKMGKAATAMKQIKEQKYYEKYQNKNQQICLVGIGFDAKERNIGEWELEEWKRKP